VSAPASARSSSAAHDASRQALAFVGRVLALLLLPLSIAPVLLLGPSVLRAPVALAKEAYGDARSLEHSLRGRLDPPVPWRPPPAPTPGPSDWRPTVSLGSVYGRWSAFPQAGREGITWTGAR
jgi:hypothetical protein